MAPPAPEARGGELFRRILSALVLAPVALGAVVLGGAPLVLFAAAAAGVLAWEWARMCGAQRDPAQRLLLIGGAPAAVAAGGFTGGYGAAALACFVAAGGLLAAHRFRRSGRPGWTALGLVYVALPCLLLLWLRGRPGAGMELVVWVLVVTWAADIGGFAVGRALGGPRLAPAVSPGKTWSGLGGALLAASAAGAALAAGRAPQLGALAGLIVGLAAAAGDLCESAAKRRFGVKDTGGMIPGHGGLLDRVDGLLFAVPVAAALWWAGWRWL